MSLHFISSSVQALQKCMWCWVGWNVGWHNPPPPSCPIHICKHWHSAPFCLTWKKWAQYTPHYVGARSSCFLNARQCPYYAKASGAGPALVCLQPWMSLSSQGFRNVLVRGIAKAIDTRAPPSDKAPNCLQFFATIMHRSSPSCVSGTARAALQQNSNH